MKRKPRSKSGSGVLSELIIERMNALPKDNRLDRSSIMGALGGAIEEYVSDAISAAIVNMEGKKDFLEKRKAPKRKRRRAE